MSIIKQNTLKQFAALIFMTLWIYPATVDAQSSPTTRPATAPLENSTQTDVRPDTTQLPAIPDDGVKRYLVELIILQNNTGTETNTEIWDRLNVLEPDPRYGPGATDFDPSTMQPPYASNTGTDPGQQGDPAGFSASEHDLPPQIVPTGLEHLASSLKILHLNDQYKVMKHAAWIQPLSNKKRAPLVELSKLPVYLSMAPTPTNPTWPVEPASQVSGTLRIYENQLLFVEAELTFRRPASTGPTAPQIADPDLTQQSPVPNHGPIIFKLNEKRRVKLNELHYFDHPYYGVLIRISRWGKH